MNKINAIDEKYPNQPLEPIFIAKTKQNKIYMSKFHSSKCVLRLLQKAKGSLSNILISFMFIFRCCVKKKKKQQLVINVVLDIDRV